MNKFERYWDLVKAVVQVLVDWYARYKPDFDAEKLAKASEKAREEMAMKPPANIPTDGGREQ